MLIIPAIDLLGGEVVRLHQGAYDEVTRYGTPSEALRRFMSAGASRVHVVDLDAARSGGVVNNLDVLGRLREQTHIPLQVGGGFRTAEALERAFSRGVAYAVVGSLAARDPLAACAFATRWPGRVLVGLDVRNGEVATEGWTESSGVRPADLLHQLAGAPFGGVIATDIARDGALSGPNLSFLQALMGATELPLIASGGVSTRDDLEALNALAHEGRRLYGVVVGKALYEGTVDLEDVLQKGLK